MNRTFFMVQPDFERIVEICVDLGFFMKIFG